MRRAVVAATVAIMSVGNSWRVEFTARPNNAGVQFETMCFGKDQHLSFSAIDYVQVDGDAVSALTFRRHNEAPRTDACTVKAFVFANDHKGDTFFGADPSGDYLIDSSDFTEQH